MSSTAPERVPQEIEHFDRLFAFFQGTVADLILGEVAESHDRGIRAGLERAGARPIDPAHDARISTLLTETQAALGFDGPIDLYWSAGAGSFARAIPSSTSEAYNFVICSPSVRALSDAALIFLLGHEVAHIAFRHQVLRWIMETVFPAGSQMPPFLRNELEVWAQCAELSCDRAGVHTAGGVLDAAREVFAAVETPALPPVEDRLRVLADPGTLDEVYGRMLRRPTSSYAQQLVELLDAAGALLARADGNVLENERSYILNRISRHSYAGTGLEARLDASVAEARALVAGAAIRDGHPDRANEAFLNLAVVVVRDGKVTAEEYALLTRLGRDALGLDAGAMRDLLLRVFRSEFFRPFDE